MSQRALDPITWDLQLVDGRLRRTADNVELLVQKARIRLQFILGEWFLDLRQGLPWFSEILIKDPSLTRIRVIFRETLITMPGVVAVPVLDLTLDSPVRGLTVDWRMELDNGQVISSTDYEPFILEIM